ncbi:protein serine/threonine phosphatase 2C [Apiospora sp. TS-2023a]
MLPSSQENLDDKDQAVLAYSSNCPNEKNEDRQSDDTFFVNGAPVRVLGVYDGHGGPWTSEYVIRALPVSIQQHIENVVPASSSIPNILVTPFEQVDRGIVEPMEATFSPVLSTIRYNLPFARRRNDIAKKAVVEQMLQDQTLLELALRAKSGSTALIAYIDRTDIHVANLGDCRANGHNPAEYARVRQEHPKDTNDPFTGGRLFGMMPLTRSFGDSFYKATHLSYHEAMSPYYPLLETPPYLTATPEVISHRRSPDDVFMIMASDGVWAIKGMTNEWVVAKAMEALSNASVEDPSRYVMEEVRKWKPGDDVTIQVIVFSPNRLTAIKETSREIGP